MFLLKLALRTWKTAFWSQLFSVLVLGVGLSMVGFFIWLDHAIKPLAHTLQNEQVLTVYLAPGLTPDQETKAADSIRLSLGAYATKSEIQLVRPEQFVGLLKNYYPSLGAELENLGPTEMGAVVPRYISISGVMPAEVAERVKTAPGIESVESTKGVNRQTISAFRAISFVSKFFAIGLGLALFTGIIHLGRINAFLHRDTASLIRFWGGGSLMILMPRIISGLWVGALGGILGFVGWCIGIPWFVERVRIFSPLFKQLNTPNLMEKGMLIFVAGILLGIIAGFSYDRVQE